MLPINEIICEDCLEVMKDWPDNCVDLVLTDPFYVPKKNFEWKTFDDFYWDFNKKWLLECQRILKNNFHLFISFSSIDMFKFEGILRETGFDIKSRIVWNYRNSTKATAKDTIFAKTYDFIFHCSSGKILNFPQQWDDKRFDVKTIAIPQTNFKKEKKVHPFQKPMELVKMLVEFGSCKSEIVFDPFCGSGTTCKAAQELGRRYIGIDISEKYCEIARQRLEAVDTGVPVREQRQGQQPLFPIEKV